MAGGEGTRLRPLTSNCPKPMIPVVNRPVMEHIIKLVKDHGITDVVATLQFLADNIKGYFSDGSDLGVDLHYAVEDSPLGTAGSVKNVGPWLDETFVVISGDALTDIDLTEAIAYHREKGALATLVLKHEPNPLEFGVVMLDDDGRIERFLEKPAWGQVFSDTINTGIYILEPSILKDIPDGESFDFSKDLFPMLLERGEPLFGFVADGYWCDIGNLEQFVQAQHDVLSESADVDAPGIRMEGNIWIGDGAVVHPEAEVEGPVVIGQHSRVDAGAKIKPFTVIGDNTIVSKDATVERTVVLNNSYIGVNATVRGAVLGRHCDVKRGSRIEEGVVVGDECVIGAGSTISHHVRIFPFKRVEAGAVVNDDIIWESRGSEALFGKAGISGLINIDITPELAVRIGMAFGTALQKDSHVALSRDAGKASRILKRALLTGLAAAGVNARDLRTAPAALNRFTIRSTRCLAGIHVGSAQGDPQSVQISFFDSAGIDIDEAYQRNIEKYFHRNEFRRAFFDEVGEVVYPPRSSEFYINEVFRQLDIDVIREAGFKIALDYAHGSSSLVLPGLLGKLGADVVAFNPFTSEEKTGLTPEELKESLDRLSEAIGVFRADFGALLDAPGERLYLVDDKGRVIDPHTALLVFVDLIGAAYQKKGTIVLPLNVSSIADVIAAKHGCTVERTKVSKSALQHAALQRKVIFGGTSDGGYVFPRFMPAFDAMASFCHFMELLAKVGKPLSELVDALPEYHFGMEEVYCPWDHKGRVMRMVAEQSKDKELLLLDGVKVIDDGDWALVLPDPEEPFVYVCADGSDDASTNEMLGHFGDMVKDIVAGKLEDGDQS